MSQLYSSVKPIRMSSPETLRSTSFVDSNSTVLIIGPSTSFTDGSIEAYRSYLFDGGRIVLADDFGTGNSLLQGLGVGVRFSGVPMEDALYRERQMMPQIFNITESEYTVGVKELVMDIPTVLNQTDGLQVLAYASFSSYLDNSKTTKTYGPYPAVAVATVGNGMIFLISDSSIFMNSLLSRGDNAKLLGNLIHGVAVIDEANSVPSRLTVTRAWMSATYAILSRVEVKYSLVGLTVLALFKVKWVEEEPEEKDEVEEALKVHPEWSRRDLEELRETRRKARGN